MTGSAPSPAAPGKRKCGICGKPLSQYNKDDICMSHKPEDVLAYRKKTDGQAKESRAILAFIKDFHRESTAGEMLAEAKKAPATPTRRRAVLELERYPEALGLLKIASLIFRLSMPGILRKSTDPTKGTKAKLARDVLSYIMTNDLEMPPEDIATFLGYKHLPRVSVGVHRIKTAMLAEFDEDIVCAVDMVRNERDLRSAEEE